ncbi:MAG: hypothetical protein ACKPKO_44715, partial [Candidatus Fonsibacter sp.]
GLTHGQGPKPPKRGVKGGLREEFVVQHKGVLLRLRKGLASFLCVDQRFQKGKGIQRSPGAEDRHRVGLALDVELDGPVNRKKVHSSETLN